MDKSSLRIDPKRLRDDFDALAQVGATPGGGVNRPALGPAHLEARSWLRERIKASGLEFRVDGAGNHSGVLPCGPADSNRTLLLGSHSDSVPDGGRFDGALGLLAALEVLRTVQDAGLRLPVHLEAIDFTDEEGTLVGLLGSAALAGRLTADALRSPRGGRDALEAGMARAGLSEESLLSARRDPGTLAGYLELHIEQGPRLLESRTDIGIVTGIVGIHSERLIFLGQANHAGTTPMDRRHDAGLGASAFVLAARERVMRDFPGAVVNVGRMAFSPGAYNIVPGVAELALEYRSVDPGELSSLKRVLLELAGTEAARFGLELNHEARGEWPPSPMDPVVRAAFRDAAEGLGLSHTELASGAGHDAQSLAGLCPAGMIFVPSVGGISHDPREYTEWDDCVNGANVLLGAAIKLAEA